MPKRKLLFTYYVRHLHKATCVACCILGVEVKTNP